MLRLIGFYDYTVILTYLSLVSSVIGIVLSARSSFSIAVCCLMISGFCDAFDGIVARSKKNRTADEKAFGIQIDSLCDAVSFGVFPAVLCYHMGVNGILGIAFIVLYILCAVIRLAFFNVIEGNRQKNETGCNKMYRGLPVTSISLIFPLVSQLRYFIPDSLFIVILHILLITVAFLFVLDFSVKKPDLQKLLTGKH